MTHPITPRELADLVDDHLSDGLLAFDVDGVLAPIVEHADDSALLDGTLDALAGLTARTSVAIVSGRALESLERLFAFPPEVHVIGSHGLEVRGSEIVLLDANEQGTFEQLQLLAAEAVAAAGDGAWLEFKPASVVLHTRSADPELAARAVGSVSDLASMIDGAEVKAGRQVLELLARRSDKGTALRGLAGRLGRSPMIYFGDDVTDEDAFEVLVGGDITVRVGPGETAARYRLDHPAAVAEFLQHLTT